MQLAPGRMHAYKRRVTCAGFFPGPPQLRVSNRYKYLYCDCYVSIAPTPASLLAHEHSPLVSNRHVPCPTQRTHAMGSGRVTQHSRREKDPLNSAFLNMGLSAPSAAQRASQYPRHVLFVNAPPLNFMPPPPPLTDSSPTILPAQEATREKTGRASDGNDIYSWGYG